MCQHFFSSCLPTNYHWSWNGYIGLLPAYKVELSTISSTSLSFFHSEVVCVCVCFSLIFSFSSLCNYFFFFFFFPFVSLFFRHRLCFICRILWSHDSRARSSALCSWCPPTASPPSCHFDSCTGECWAADELLVFTLQKLGFCNGQSVILLTSSSEQRRMRGQSGLTSSRQLVNASSCKKRSLFSSISSGVLVTMSHCSICIQTHIYSRLCLCVVRSLFIATVRECYEAYVIYCFLHFLVGTLGDGLPAANRCALSNEQRWPWTQVLWVEPWPGPCSQSYSSGSFLNPWTSIPGGSSCSARSQRLQSPGFFKLLEYRAWIYSQTIIVIFILWKTGSRDAQNVYLSKKH